MERVKSIIIFAMVIVIAISFTGCANGDAFLNEMTLYEIIAAAKKEGEVHSLAMPDEWANWGETWNDLNCLYKIEHTDNDMSSVEELELFSRGKGDIGDVGYEYGPIAEKMGVTLKYKTSYWDGLPQWAKDDDGDWMVCYTGTLAFLIDQANTYGEPCATWADVDKGTFSVAVSDVINSSLGQYTVYAAALAFGGNESNIQPGIDFFKRLAESGRLMHNVQGFEEVTKGGAGLNIRWDFLSLQYRDQALTLDNPVVFTPCIPDISVTVGYASIINKKAKNPHAAALAREYILSDLGQINLARGYATPIRSIKLPDDIENKRINASQYSEEMILYALKYTSDTADKIAEEWNKQIMPLLDGGKK